MDFTSVGVRVEHPDPEENLLPPGPLLLVATSDGALRLFTFSHTGKPTDGIVAPPLPLEYTAPILAEPVARVRLMFFLHAALNSSTLCQATSTASACTGSCGGPTCARANGCCSCRHSTAVQRR